MKMEGGLGYRLHHQTSPTAATAIDPAAVWKVGRPGWVVGLLVKAMRVVVVPGPECAKVGRGGESTHRKVDDECK